MKPENTLLDELLRTRPDDIVRQWLTEAGDTKVTPADARSVFDAFHAGVRADGDGSTIDHAAWETLRTALEKLSRNQAAKGASAASTTKFLLALKRPLFLALQSKTADAKSNIDGIWHVSTLVDQAAQFSVAAYQQSRESIIARQQEELLELSTPVVKLWDGVLAVPMIGTLDSNRTQMVMESLLQRIVDTGSALAIIDITGVPTVDTLVAQHLLKTVTAIRLMGADCIISGVRPQIAQTIVHLGIDLNGIVTKATLADALALAMKLTGYTVSRTTKL